jgi:hypothetical protein
MKARVFVSLEIHGPRSAGSDGPRGAEWARVFGHFGRAAGEVLRHWHRQRRHREQARKDVETIAHEVLANPVIEEYRVEILD